MTDRRYDPVEQHEIWKAKTDRVIELYEAGNPIMSDITFSVCLLGYGFTHKEAQAEMEMRRPTRLSRIGR